MLVLCVQDHWQCVQNTKLDRSVLMQWCSDTDLANGYSIYIGPILQLILKPCYRTVVFEFDLVMQNFVVVRVISFFFF